jgi:Ricin-type beta-trefoil lectin domain
MIYKAIFVALTAFVGSSSSASVSVYETKERLRGSAKADRELIILDGSVRGCIELKNGNTASGAKLVFGNCNRRINGFEEKDLGNTTDLVQLYSRKNTTMCMQAEPLEEGAFVRLRKCSRTNKYQKFEWYGQIKPASDKSLCVAYHGQHADIGDYIKLKKCSKFQDGWSRD